MSRRGGLPAVDHVRAISAGVDIKSRPLLAAAIRDRVQRDVARIMHDFAGDGARNLRAATELTTFYLAGKLTELELACNAWRAKP